MALMLAQFSLGPNSFIKPHKIVEGMSKEKVFEGQTEAEREMAIKIFDVTETICSRVKDIAMESIICQSKRWQSNGLSLPFTAITEEEKKSMKKIKGETKKLAKANALLLNANVGMSNKFIKAAKKAFEDNASDSSESEEESDLSGSESDSSGSEEEESDSSESESEESGSEKKKL